MSARGDQATWSFWADVVRNLFGFFRVVRDEFRTRRGRLLVKLIPMLWLGLFFAVPFLIVARISFADRTSRPTTPGSTIAAMVGTAGSPSRIRPRRASSAVPAYAQPS